MSDPVRPHRRQPTRLLHPWDSPGKNTGVGFHFLLQCMKVKSQSEVAQSYSTLRDPMDCSLPGSSVHGIFQARVLEWGAIAFSKLYVFKYIFLKFKFTYQSLVFTSLVFASFKCCRASGLKSRTSFCPFIFIFPGMYSFLFFYLFFFLFLFLNLFSFFLTL